MNEARTQTRRITRALLGSVACGVFSSCAGTPLPEPPDYAPPDLANFGDPAQESSAPTAAATTIDILFAGQAGSVDPRAELWAINLDGQGGPLRTQPTSDGAFRFATPLAAIAGDRIYLLTRGTDSHSAPLELEAFDRGELLVPPYRPLTPRGLACLGARARELDIAALGTSTLTFDNQCVGLSVDNLRLRFGDQGIALDAQDSATPSRVFEIGLRAEGTADHERGDIVLLDVSTSDGLSGRYAIPVYVPPAR